MKRVAHLTSVHSQPDARIFVKECRTLAAAGYDVTLVAPVDRDELADGVAIQAIRPSRGRLDRMTRAVRDTYRAARSLDADLYHFHDPELLGVGLRLQRLGKRVVYDVHEDVPGDILAKPWIAPRLRRPVSTAYDRMERAVAARLDAVICAAPDIAPRFEGTGVPTVTVHNFPILAEQPDSRRSWAERERAVCYVGAITALRGMLEMIDASELAGVKLLLASTFTERGGRELAAARPGWPRVEEVEHRNGGPPGPAGGVLSTMHERRGEVGEAFSRARAGLLVVHPEPNHMRMLDRSHKLFEYMSAGLPVIVSDFPDWRRFVEENGCGICVDPLDPAAIAAGIRRIVDDPDAAQRMGARARETVERAFSWETEARGLLDLYARLLSSRPQAAAESGNRM
jgi:glycosyltransferase involved in cell wall biosynthesis